MFTTSQYGVTRKEITIPEVADHKGVTTQTVRKWISKGILPAHRVGPRLIRIWADDVDKVNKPIGGAA